MAKSPYQLWKETQEIVKQGITTIPKAPYKRVQYSNPTYQGKSDTKKTYSWETENLKPMKSSKNVRSYNAKFDKWANENGLSAGEAKDFRTYLDSKEDGVKTTADTMAETLKSLQQRNQKIAEQIKNAPKRTEKPKVQEPKKEKNSLLKDIGAGFKAAGQAANPFDDVSMDEALMNFANREKSKGFKEVQRGSNRAVDAASLGAMGAIDTKLAGEKPEYREDRKIGEGGITDMATSGLGYLVPGVGFVKGAKALGIGAKEGTKGAAKLAQIAKEGAIVGGTMGAAEVGIREAITPEEYDAKENLTHVGLGTAAGIVADPLLYGAGKVIGKGAENVLGRFAKGEVPKYTGKPSQKILESLTTKETPKSPVETNYDTLLKQEPKQSPLEVPENKRELYNVQNQIEQIRPKVEEYDNEFQQAVEEQYNYLKNSMGKGVQQGGVVKDEEGFVTSAYGRISNNPKWYQDFYSANGRKPTNKELMELAEIHVREGFEDEVGSLPAWAPKDVQEIDDQINELTNLLRQDPSQEEAIRPVLHALEEDKQSILKSIDDTRNEFTTLQQKQQSLKGDTVQPMRLPEGVQAMQGDTIPLRQPTGNKQFKDMTFWESAVNKIKKATGSKDVYEKPITRRELVGNMRKNLGVTIRTGRLNTSDEVKGYFKVNPEVIRTRQHGDIQVISHEIGHALDKQFKLTNEAFDDELTNLGANTSGADYTPEQVREEGLAEFIRLFLTDPNKAVSEAPNFSQHFDTALPKKVKNGLLKTQSDVDTWIEQGPELRLSGKIDRTGKELETIGEKLDKVYTQFIDKFDNLAKVEKAITGKINDGSKSLYKKARTSAGAPKIAQMILDTEFKPIFEPIEKYGYSMKDVGDYVTAAHALELENMGQKVANEAAEELTELTGTFKESQDVSSLFKSLTEFQKQYDIDLDDAQLNAIRSGQEIELNEDQLYKIAQENRIESGMTLEEINSVLKKYDSPEMKQVQEQIVEYNNGLLARLKDAQILSEDSIKAMNEKYPNYVPFYRFFEDDITVGMTGNKGFTNLANPVKRLKGSTRDVIDPLESIVKNTFAVVNAVEKNKVGLELSRLADIEGAGRYIERLDGAQQVKQEHIVTVFENGEKVQYQLDKDLYEAVQQLNEDQTNKVIQFLSYPTAALRAGATLTPEFMLRNPIRDQFQAFVVSNNGYNPIIDLPRGAWHVFFGKAFNKSDVYKQWVMKGGGYGNYLSQDRNYLRDTLKQLKKEGKSYQRGFRTITNPKELGNLILNTLQTMSEFSEEATKVGEFRKAMKKGSTPEEAAFQSRDLMDFARVGTDLKQWNRAVAFLNANLQGKDRIARAFKNNPIRTTIKAVSAVTVPQIGAIMAMELLANDKQKETYENTPSWMKDTFFILPIPGTDELARIPKPFDLSPVFANPVTYIWDYIKDNDPEAASEFLLSQGKELLKIPHMLTGLTPIIENITNYSFFTGGPIVPMRDQDLLPEDQYGVSTSLTARTIGKATGSSPYKVDNLIRGYGAGLGKYATSALDKGLEKAGAGTIPPQEAKKWSEFPVVNAFTVDSTGGGQIMTDFYESLDKLKVERNSAKRNEKTYERDDDYKLINKASRDISELRNEYRSVQGSYNLSPEQKRSQLDALDRQMNQLAREALIRIGEKTK